jgi:uncharacterized membrane protein
VSRDRSRTPVEAGESLYEGVTDVLMTGIAIIVPLVITIYVLNAVLGFVTDALRPLVDLLKWMGAIQWFQDIRFIELLIQLDVYTYVVDFLGELIAVIVLVGVVVLVGSLGQHRYGQQVVGFVDLAISSVPGAGTVYKSFRRMGDVMLDEGSENFEEVKLVQCLGDDIYMLGFETGQSPEAPIEATGHDDMVTMFLPLAPNPVTGGYLTYVPESRVYDVDMTIEEGIRSILTSGVAADDEAGMLPEDHALSDVDSIEDVVPGAEEAEATPDDEEREHGTRSEDAPGRMEAGPDDERREEK